MLKEYHKIKAPFLRDVENKKLTNTFIDYSIAYLSDNEWKWTEKVDGTNIRIHWDGHKLSLYGRTDKSQIPSDFIDYYFETFINSGLDSIIEQRFEDNEVTLIGEGYGGKIQGKKEYGDTKFVLFDVCFNGTYLDREDMEHIGKEFRLNVVPTVLIGTIDEAIGFVKTHPKSLLGDLEMEGVVGTPLIPLLDKYGKRIITKVKVKDFAN